MFRVAVLCLAVFVGVASAWDWRGKNRRTECGKYKPILSWFSKPRTDLDTRRLLGDIDILDVNKDGFVTYPEITNETTLLSVNPTLTIGRGVPRCDQINFDMKRYGMSREVANALFNMIDNNNDQVYSLQDQPPESFNMNDRNGDGRVSRCELFQTYMSGIQMAEKFVHDRELKYENLVWESRERRWSWFSW